MRWLNHQFKQIGYWALGAAAATCSALAFAQGTAPVPTKLFGITLGSIFEIDPAKGVDPKKVPVKEFRGIGQFLGEGVHFYFEPLTVNPTLPYAEEKKTPKDEYYKTSYRLYLLPVAPSGAKSIEEFEKSILNWEVTSINWEEVDPKRDTYTKDSKEENEARVSDYFWAMSLCKTFEAEFKVKPEIADFNDTKTYICKFTQDERTFEVSSFYRRAVRLSFRRDISDKKGEAIGTIRKQLRARELLK